MYDIYCTSLQIIDMRIQYVTVHAKTSLVRTKIEIHFFTPALATHISYLHSMSPMARLNWSAFLGVDLQPCKTMTDTLAPVERANWVQPAWNSTLNRNGVPSV